MGRDWLRWFIFCGTLSLLAADNNASDPTYDKFEDPQSERFHHMMVHDYTEKVYVGGVNRIYQLSRDLRLEAAAVMGPKDDSPKCPVTRLCPNEPKKPTDYFNKALVIDYAQSKLVACGSLYQGICTVHNLNDVTEYEMPANESVVANNATASTVAFIAPGPKNLPRTHALYVGVSYTANGPYRSDVPAVSSRSLDPNNMFAIAHTGVTTGTKVMVNKTGTRSTTPFISKLVRICQEDVHYYSYTEVRLACRASDGTDYNLAQAAYVGRPGSELAVSLGITAQDDVLFAVFAKSRNASEDSYSKPGDSSAVCVYALSAVHRKFTQNIQHCFNGGGDRGLDFINPSQKCMNTLSQEKFRKR
ncbi:PlexA [Cordylochernes scorpioides]|uniref:PlexA n=1 Tax=Cordylochernes scorpioides TaxID=51811 RepID=A0ABY6KLC0_9ARAC|nr:PlexA [Cordylochernes scorpioides]